MAGEKFPRDRIEEILKNQPPTLRSPLEEGVNVFEDGHFVAAFEAVRLRRIQVIDENITIGEYLARCGEKNGNTQTYRRVFHLDEDTRPIEDIVLSYLTLQMAKFLPLDSLDMLEGHTERRVRSYSERYRSGSSYSNEPLYRFMMGTYTPEGRVLKINVGGMIGAELIPIADRLTPLWISYLRGIVDVHPKALRNSGYVTQYNMTELPKLPSYSEWAKQQQIEFNKGLQAELAMLGYRATLRNYQRKNLRPRKD